MQIILTIGLIFGSIGLNAMHPKKNLNCVHRKITSNIVTIYSITCPKGQMPYTGNSVPSDACYTTRIKNCTTQEVTYKATCLRNNDGSFPKPYIKK